MGDAPSARVLAPFHRGDADPPLTGPVRARGGGAQLVDWALRVGTAAAMLAAFGIPPGLRYAVLAVVIDSVSTALPVTPGGIGAQQGLLVFALAGVATSGQVLAYSVGAQAVIMAFNVLLGLIATFVLFGHLRMGAVRREADAWPGLNRQ